MDNQDIESVAGSKSAHAKTDLDRAAPGMVEEGVMVTLTNEEVCPPLMISDERELPNHLPSEHSNQKKDRQNDFDYPYLGVLLTGERERNPSSVLYDAY